MNRNIVETVMGGVVLLVALALLGFAYLFHAQSSSYGTIYTAKFDRIDGLAQGSDVKLGGIKVGTIGKIHLDPETYLAVVEIHVNPEVKLPEDTVASVASEGLLGGKFMLLEPGGSETHLLEKGEIKYTQSSMNLESLIGHMIFGNEGSKDGKEASGDQNSKTPGPQGAAL